MGKGKDIKNCYNELKKDLGNYDVLVEFIELSKCRITDINTGQEEINKYINEYSRQYNILLKHIDVNQLTKSLNYLYLSFPEMVFERYLVELSRQINGITELQTPTGYKEYNYFEKFYRRLAFNDINIDIDKQEENIIDYYRLIRNKYVHGNDDVLSKINSTYAAIERNMINDKRYNIKITNDVPHRYEEINISDCILYSAVIHSLAQSIYEQVWDNLLRDISLNELEYIGITKTQLMKHKQPNKLKQFITNYIHTTIGVDIKLDDDQINNILSSIV